MIILGIDPGSRFLGYGVVSVQGTKMTPIDYGVLKFDPDVPLSERLQSIGLGVRELFDRYKPEHLSLEKIFLGKNADSAFKMGHARGVVIYESLLANCKVYEYATRVVKKGITGNGGAEKEHVRLVVRNMLQIGPVKSLDASDALAMACFHATQLRMIDLKQRSKQQELA
ncbi:crossover junction endodeoxyribonuclease RuvC [Pseudobdellovibrio exovorus]|uniref:Crossover junction endodeoxyribonuclease RuvC n=1 Tax=Pseudobdellovibrio exovorus JSS TaxID=1184267 RepID=M4V715_9BACT|nr:crossover junction endodeoxyribonuclease RuvC [Pseudobdellovibrio exovorus]AGH95182.1 crossover junction endodeoxyribonuclease RuvC [Pseudobdellovibrio exovorus JSS]